MQPISVVPSDRRLVGTTGSMNSNSNRSNRITLNRSSNSRSSNSPQSWPIRGVEQAIPLVDLLEQAQRHARPVLHSFNAGNREQQQEGIQTILVEVMDILSELDGDRDLGM